MCLVDMGHKNNVLKEKALVVLSLSDAVPDEGLQVVRPHCFKIFSELD